MTLICVVFALLTTAGDPAASDAVRARRIQEQLLAPCCYSESVAEHRSEIALQVRREIDAMIRENKTDREILDFYKQKYGARILVEPEGTTGFVLSVIPLVVLAAGLVLVAILIRRLRHRTHAASAQTPVTLPDIPDDID